MSRARAGRPLLSLLALALGAACGGPRVAVPPPAPTAAAVDPDELVGDLIAGLGAAVDEIQNDVDDAFGPIKNADATIQGVVDLGYELRRANSKVDPRRLLAEANKLLEGADADLAALGIEGDVQAKVVARFDKLRALIVSIKTMPGKVAALQAKISELPEKLSACVSAARGAAAKAIIPFGVSVERKKKAAQHLKTVEGFMTEIPKRIEDWMQDAAELPAKAKDLPAIMHRAFAVGWSRPLPQSTHSRPVAQPAPPDPSLPVQHRPVALRIPPETEHRLQHVVATHGVAGVVRP